RPCAHPVVSRNRAASDRRTRPISRGRDHPGGWSRRWASGRRLARRSWTRRGPAMLDRQRLARNGPALALPLGWVCPAFSLAGYQPADAPGLAAEPANATPATPCGPVGATLAFLLFQALGWAAPFLLVGLGAVDLLMFRRRRAPEAWIQITGF